MRVRYCRGETELLGLSWMDFMNVKLPDLTVVPEDDLRRSHKHAKRQVWEASGPHRMGAGHVVLNADRSRDEAPRPQGHLLGGGTHAARPHRRHGAAGLRPVSLVGEASRREGIAA